MPPGAPASMKEPPATARILHRDHIVSRLDPLSHDFNEAARRGTHAAAAVLIPLIDRPEGLSVLLTVRNAALRRHAGQIAFPGGRAEPDEAPWQTALREAHEEIDLSPEFVEVAGQTADFNTHTGYAISPVVGFVSPQIALTANPVEVADIFEAPLSFLMDVANHQTVERVTPDGERREVWAIPYGERQIWGITATLLRELSDRLNRGA